MLHRWLGSSDEIEPHNQFMTSAGYQSHPQCYCPALFVVLRKNCMNPKYHLITKGLRFDRAENQGSRFGSAVADGRISLAVAFSFHKLFER